MKRFAHLLAVLALSCGRPAASGFQADSVRSVVVLPDAVTPDAGPASACTTLDWSNATVRAAWHESGRLDVPSTGVTLERGADTLTLELFFFGTSANRTFPATEMLWNTTLATCELCVRLNRGASGAWLANGGEVEWLAADRTTPGRIAGSADVVRFVEWNFGVDAAVDGGSCVEVTGIRFDASW